AGVVVRRDRGGSPAPRWHVLFAGLCVTFRVGVTAAVLGVGLFDLGHDPVGQLLAQRGITQLTGHLTSGFVGQGPGPEIDDRVGTVLLVAAGVGEDPVGACDRVPLATDVVDGELEVLRYFGFLGGRDRRLQGRLDRFTVLVDDAGDGQARLLGEGLVDIAQTTGVLGDALGDTVVLLATDTTVGPVQFLALAVLVGPTPHLGAPLVRAHVGGAGTVRAVDWDALVARQLHVGVEFGDGRVVEGGDVPGVDARDGLRVQDEAVQVRVVEGDDDRAEHDGKLHGPAVPGIGRSGQFLVVQVLLGGAEVDGLFEELFNTGAGADALVVDADIGLDVVGVGVHPVMEARVV